jgi:hypothetical protein
LFCVFFFFSFFSFHPSLRFYCLFLYSTNSRYVGQSCKGSCL